MADTSAWPSMSNIVLDAGLTFTFTAGADIKAGQVVAFAGTGVSRTVQPAVAGTTGPVAGVACDTVDSGDAVTVCYCGIVKVVEGTGNAIDAGDYVMDDDCAIVGCVKGAVVTATSYGVVGQAIDDIAANGSGYIRVCPTLVAKAAT